MCITQTNFEKYCLAYNRTILIKGGNSRAGMVKKKDVQRKMSIPTTGRTQDKQFIW